MSITKKGKSGANAISKLMEGFRDTPPKKIGGILIQTIEDYKNSSHINLKNQQKKEIDLPQADVLVFILEDGSRISLRPSGTEPKIKFYFSVNTSFNNTQSLSIYQKELGQKIDLFINDLIG